MALNELVLPQKELTLEFQEVREISYSVIPSNANDVLTEFLKTGYYNRQREFYTTVSPSMDILISSNLERLLFLLSGMNDKQVLVWMESLSKDGHYRVNDEVFGKIKALFEAGSCDDEGTKKTIAETFENNGYLCDTHTGVAVAVYNDYVKNSGDNTSKGIGNSKRRSQTFLTTCAPP